jgi:hypothetical protein
VHCDNEVICTQCLFAVHLFAASTQLLHHQDRIRIPPKALGTRNKDKLLLMRRTQYGKGALQALLQQCIECQAVWVFDVVLPGLWFHRVLHLHRQSG